MKSKSQNTTQTQKYTTYTTDKEGDGGGGEE